MEALKCLLPSLKSLSLSVSPITNHKGAFGVQVILLLDDGEHLGGRLAHDGGRPLRHSLHAPHHTPSACRREKGLESLAPFILVVVKKVSGIIYAFYVLYIRGGKLATSKNNKNPTNSPVST